MCWVGWRLAVRLPSLVAGAESLCLLGMRPGGVGLTIGSEVAVIGGRLLSFSGVRILHVSLRRCLSRMSPTATSSLDLTPRRRPCCFVARQLVWACAVQDCSWAWTGSGRCHRGCDGNNQRWQQKGEGDTKRIREIILLRRQLAFLCDYGCCCR